MDKIKFLIKRFFLVTVAGAMYKYLPIKFPPIPSASAIITKGAKILVVRLTYKNGYGLPGGVLQKQEGFEDGVKREVFEETGLRITSLNYFHSYYTWHDYPTVNNTYIARASGNLRKSKEGIPEWHDPKEVVDKMVFPDNQQAVKDFLKNKTISS